MVELGSKVVNLVIVFMVLKIFVLENGGMFVLGRVILFSVCVLFVISLVGEKVYLEIFIELLYLFSGGLF